MSEQTQIEALTQSTGSAADPAPAPAPAEGSERVPLRELEDGQRVAGVYAVRERELRRKRNGEPWLRLSVGDATGTAEAVCWEEAEALRAVWSRLSGLRPRRLRDQRALGGEDQAQRGPRGGVARVRDGGPCG